MSVCAFSSAVIIFSSNSSFVAHSFLEATKVSIPAFFALSRAKAPGFEEMTRLIFLSDYFDISLDYLVRGVEKEDVSRKQTEQIEYQTDTLKNRIQAFMTNLNGNQKELLIIIYILVTINLYVLIYNLPYIYYTINI